MENCHGHHNNTSKMKHHGGHEMTHGNGHDMGHGMGHGSASSYIKRFWIVTVLLIPLVLANAAVSGFLGFEEVVINKWIQFAIATVIFGFALVFFKHASHELKARKPGMMTLVSLAVGAGFLFSVASTFISTIDVEFYLEISTLVWVLLFGHYLEAKSSNAAGNALSLVEKLLPQTAHLKDGDTTRDVSVSELSEGDVVLVKPGEKIPADGIVVEGSSSVDESHISGESKPISKNIEDKVVAGAVCLDGSLTVKLTRVGENSTVGQIKKLIAEAGKTKPRGQRIADKAALVLTVVAGSVALGTILVWSLVLGETFVFSLTLAITVLVIACPHALGLAIPTVTTITTTLAVKNGIFIKNLAKIEVIKKADYVVFDKTGTLTEGKFGVSKVTPVGGHSEDEVLRVAASLERNSSHVIGYSIIEHAKAEGINLSEIKNFKNIAGKGIEAEIEGVKYYAGNKALLEDIGVKETEDFQNEGTLVWVANDEEVIGYISLADKIKEESKQVVKKLHELGLKVAMLTGDSKVVAENVGREIGIDTVFAEVLPGDKYEHIKSLQEKGNVVLMVGDGVNDAPALTQADAGVAIGAGTDIAVEAGDIVLTESNPRDVAKLIVLARGVYRKMIQNLVWALGYNIIAIPAAAGVFAYWGFFLQPAVGAIVMSLSTVIVVINAMMLKRIKL